MNEPTLICPQCHQRATSIDGYCSHCGAPIDATLIAELQWLYRTLQDLDQRIASGQAQMPLAQLRTTYFTRYQAANARRPPAQVVAPVAPAPSPAAPSPALIAKPQSQPVPVAVAYAAESSLPPQAVPTPAEPQPIFSWRAFVADQAITIMAYLGGFLLLVATLSFEIGAWQVLDNAIKLLVVAAVYLTFGGLGVAFWRVPRLRTVSRAYMGVFGLMTPLVCFAVYRFALQAQHIPPAGMLTLSALYAIVVYLALAWRTRFAVYGYLGWSALVLAALALLFWLGVSPAWWTTIMAATALILLAPYHLRRVMPDLFSATPAVHLAALVTVPTVVVSEVQGLQVWSGPVSGESFFPTSATPPSLAVFVSVACLLVPLALGWALTLRRRLPALDEQVLASADWSVAAAVAQAIIALGAGAQIGGYRLIALLIVVALGEMGLAVALSRLWPTRMLLRRGIAGLALVLGLVAVWGAASYGSPNGLLGFALLGETVSLLALTALEGDSLWAAVTGLFASLAFWDAANLWYPIMLNNPGSEIAPPNPVLALFGTAFVLALWALAVAMSFVPALRRYVISVAVVAVGNAVIVLWLLLIFPGHAIIIQVVIPLLFATAALALGARLKQRSAGAWSFAGFGAVVVLPVPLHSNDGVALAVVVLSAWLLALLLRLIDRTAFYALALWATVVIVVPLGIFGSHMTTADWSLIGIPFGAWVALGSAAIASLIALAEAKPERMVTPAVLALAALLVTREPLAVTLLVFALIGAGMLLRLSRSPEWIFAVQAVAAIGSLLAIERLGTLGVHGSLWQFAVALAFAAAVYAIAVQERIPAISSIAVFYALFALRVVPNDSAFLLSLLMVYALAVLTLVLHRFVRFDWVIALYVIAGFSVLGVIAAALREPSDVVWHIVALFSLVPLAYANAVREDRWYISLAGVPTALVAASLFSVPAFVPQFILTLVAALLAVALRRQFAATWVATLYVIAVGVSVFAINTIQPQDAAHLEAIFLIFAAVAYLVTVVEPSPAVAIVPVLYAFGAVREQTDPHLLLPLALLMALLGLLAGRLGGWGRSLPFYSVALLAAVATGTRGSGDMTFLAVSLALIAVATYVIAAVEARADLLVAALVVGAFALGTANGTQTWEPWHNYVTFIALSWGYTALAYLWRVLPTTGTPSAAQWWTTSMANTAMRERWNAPRLAGVAIHRWLGLLLALGTVFANYLAPESFSPHVATTQVLVLALLSLAGLLALAAPERHVLWYFTGGFVVLAANWELRWLGAENIQAFTLLPGSYQLLLGALVPADPRLENRERWGQLWSLAGSLTLLLPTLLQTFSPDSAWAYATILAVEAILIVGVGIGTQARLVVMTGLAFVGIAALRGGVLAIDSGVPVAIVIAFFAVLLMGAATWLSLRTRRESGI